MGKIIGIDLGTTNSCVAVMEGNEPVVIPNSEGRRTTPSIVAFVDNGERKVGDPAKRQAITNPHKTIYSIKRFMGETYDQVGNEIKRVPYQVVRGDNNTPRVVIDNRQYSPQEISAMVLQKMKKTAEDYLGQEVTEAVITNVLSTNRRLPLWHTVWIKSHKTRRLPYSTWVAVRSISPFWNWVMVYLK